MSFQWEEEEEEEESQSTQLFLSIYRGKEGKKNFSPAGNRTPVFRVTGGDTHHYTTEEVKMWGRQKGLIATPCNCSMRKKKEEKAVPVRGIEPRPRR